MSAPRRKKPAAARPLEDSLARAAQIAERAHRQVEQARVQVLKANAVIRRLRLRLERPGADGRHVVAGPVK